MSKEQIICNWYEYQKPILACIPEVNHHYSYLLSLQGKHGDDSHHAMLLSNYCLVISFLFASLKYLWGVQAEEEEIMAYSCFYLFCIV